MKRGLGYVRVEDYLCGSVVLKHFKILEKKIIFDFIKKYSEKIPLKIVQKDMSIYSFGYSSNKGMPLG